MLEASLEELGQKGSVPLCVSVHVSVCMYAHYVCEKF